MNHEDAKRIIAASEDYISFKESGCVGLDGRFTLEELEAIVYLLREDETPEARQVDPIPESILKAGETYAKYLREGPWKNFFPRNKKCPPSES